MMNETENDRELISALADGQLRGEEFAKAVALASAPGEARQAWHAYHVVGDVLRGNQVGSLVREAAFLARLERRMEQEKQAPQVMTAMPDAPVAQTIISESQASRQDVKSANDAVFRWKMVAGFASLAAVTVIGWQAIGTFAPENASAKLALANDATPVVAVMQPQFQAQPQVMLRDPQLDALLAAHRQFGGASALQMPAGFLRNATFEGAAR